MRTRRARAVASLRGFLVVAVAAAALVACGNGDDKETKERVTVPRDTTAPRPSLPPPSLPSGPLESIPPRPWRTGFAHGVMPLQLDAVALAKDLDGMAATGARWLRVDFYWPTVQDEGPESWNWSGTDRIVKMAHARGLQILAMPAYSPDWARPPGTNDHHPPLDPDWYARFVHEAAKRYAPLGVH